MVIKNKYGDTVLVKPNVKERLTARGKLTDSYSRIIENLLDEVDHCHKVHRDIIEKEIKERIRESNDKSLKYEVHLGKGNDDKSLKYEMHLGKGNDDKDKNDEKSFEKELEQEFNNKYTGG